MGRRAFPSMMELSTPFRASNHCLEQWAAVSLPGQLVPPPMLQQVPCATPVVLQHTIWQLLASLKPGRVFNYAFLNRSFEYCLVYIILLLLISFMLIMVGGLPYFKKPKLNWYRGAWSHHPTHNTSTLLEEGAVLTTWQLLMEKWLPYGWDNV